MRKIFLLFFGFLCCTPFVFICLFGGFSLHEKNNSFNWERCFLIVVAIHRSWQVMFQYLKKGKVWVIPAFLCMQYIAVWCRLS